MRSTLDLLPGSWRSELSGARVEPIRSGSGGGFVFRVGKSGRTTFLKIARGGHANHLREEIERTRWLAAQTVNVPAILQTIEQSEFSAVFMSALKGEPVESCPLPPNEIIYTLAAGLAKLHTLPVASCPFDESVKVRLVRAETDVAVGRIDSAAFDKRNAAFSPKQLLDRLLAIAPTSEDTVVVHGDATFTNLFVDSAGLGFIDCSRSGKADRYVDLALVATEIEERFGREGVRHFFRAYGFDFHAPDRQKLSFYSDLYELF